MLRRGYGLRSLTNVPAHREAGNHHNEEQQSFEDRSEILHLAAHADAFPLQNREQKNRGDGRELDARNITNPGERERTIERWKQMRHVFANHDADRAGGAACGQPVAPANDEARVIAQRPSRKIVLATAAGNTGAEFGELEGTDQGVKGSDKPYAKEEPMVREARGNVSGSAHDAGADGVADGHRDAETYTQNFQEFAAFFAWMCGRQGLRRGERCVSGGRQWAFSLARRG